MTPKVYLLSDHLHTKFATCFHEESDVRPDGKRKLFEQGQDTNVSLTHAEWGFQHRLSWEEFVSTHTARLSIIC